VSFEALCDPREAVLANAGELHRITNEKVVWGTRHSGYRLPDQVADELERLVVGREPIDPDLQDGGPHKTSSSASPQESGGRHKVARIAYNTADWQRPTGDASKFESADTYNHKFGFGHEEWLFRSEWLIDGWRYAFVQGVNKSYEKLVKAGKPFDLTLFTIQPDKRRRYVATILAVECLSDSQAGEALKIFKSQGWYDAMRKEISAVGGNDSEIGNARWARNILSVRYLQQNVQRFPPATYAESDDPIMRLSRYQLYDIDQDGADSGKAGLRGRKGSESAPGTRSFTRRPSGSIVCTPEHAEMQKKLMLELKREYPNARVVREENFVDIKVVTESDLILFEIKSDLEPRTVIRQALGQILEYAYHPSQNHTLPVQLVIVGRGVLTKSDAAYLQFLRFTFKLPVTYRVVTI
jgi:hypothetical protein